MGVDLRELHRELESGKDFSNWAKHRLSQFIEGENFIVFAQSVENYKSGRLRKDHAVSTECDKHIAMMEQTERGQQVRVRCRKHWAMPYSFVLRPSVDNVVLSSRAVVEDCSDQFVSRGPASLAR